MAQLMPAPALTQALSLIRPVARHDDNARTALQQKTQPALRTPPAEGAPGKSSRMGVGDAAEIAQLARRYQMAALSATRSADPAFPKNRARE